MYLTNNIYSILFYSTYWTASLRFGWSFHDDMSTWVRLAISEKKYFFFGPVDQCRPVSCDHVYLYCCLLMQTFYFILRRNFACLLILSSLHFFCLERIQFVLVVQYTWHLAAYKFTKEQHWKRQFHYGMVCALSYSIPSFIYFTMTYRTWCYYTSRHILSQKHDCPLQINCLHCINFILYG